MLQSPSHLVMPSPTFLVNILFPPVPQFLTVDFQAFTPVPFHPRPHQSIVKPPNLIRPLLPEAPQPCPLILDTINNPSLCLVPSSCTSSQQLLAQLLPFPPVLCSPTTPVSFPLLQCNLYSGKSYAWKCPHPPVPLPVSLYLCCNLPITDWSLWRNLP